MLAAAVVLASLTSIAPPSPWVGTLCLSAGAKPSCAATTVAHAEVPDSDVARTVTWTARSRETIVLDSILPHQTQVAFDKPELGTLTLRLADRVDPPAPVTVDIRHGSDRWTLEIAAPDVSLLHRITLPPATYRLEITAPHRRPVIRERATVVKGKTVPLGIVNLLPLISVSGRVIESASGAAIAGVTISIPGEGPLGVTDARGAFSVEFPGDAPSHLRISHAGYASKTMPLLGITVSRDFGAIKLGRGAVLHLQFDIPDRKVTAANLIRVFETDPVYIPAGHADVSNNEVTFEDVEPGSYVILAKGLLPLQQALHALDVSEGETTETIHLHPLSIDGHAYLDRKPLPGATIKIYANRRLWSGEVSTDAEGAFGGETWSSGMLTAAVRHEALPEPFVSRSRIDPTSGYWDILIPNRVISGHVLDAMTKQPIPGAKVLEEYRGHGMNLLNHSATLSGDGNWRFSAVLDGVHSIHAEADGYQSTPPVTVMLGERDESRQLDLLMQPGTSCQIQAHYENGPAAANAIVLDGLAGGGFSVGHSVLTDAAGQVTITLEPNTAKTVFVVPREGSFAMVTLKPGSADSRTFDVTIPVPAANIHFRTIRNGGFPVSGVYVLVRYNGVFVPPAVLDTVAELRGSSIGTGADGETTITNLPAGPYEFWPFMTIEDAQRIMASYGAMRSPIRAEIPPGDSTVVLTLEAQSHDPHAR